MKDIKLKKELLEEYDAEEKEDGILYDGRKVIKVKFKKNWLNKIIKEYGKDI